MTQELQEVITGYMIQLSTSLTDYISSTNPKIYQFVAIRGSSGSSVIPPLYPYSHQAGKLAYFGAALGIHEYHLTGLVGR